MIFFLTHPPCPIFGKNRAGRHAMLGGAKFGEFRGENHPLILEKISYFMVILLSSTLRGTIIKDFLLKSKILIIKKNKHPACLRAQTVRFNSQLN
jgi:hypothetical protein